MFHALRSSEESEAINVYPRALCFSTYRQEYMSDIAFAEKMYSSNQGCVVPA